MKKNNTKPPEPPEPPTINSRLNDCYHSHDFMQVHEPVAGCVTYPPTIVPKQPRFICRKCGLAVQLA